MNPCWTIQYCLNESLHQLLQHRMTIFAFAKLTFHTLIILLKLWHVHSVEYSTYYLFLGLLQLISTIFSCDFHFKLCYCDSK